VTHSHAEIIDATYRNEARRVLATLIRLLGSFDVAEEFLHEAFVAAAEQWPRDGVPDNRYAWLVSTARFKAVSRWRRQARLAGLCLDEPPVDASMPGAMLPTIQDDELRLIFICCHPDLTQDARIALTLREVCGLTTEEIARAYLTTAPTIAQRIVRAKAQIRADGIPYEVPERAELPGRLESVLLVVYLIFNEGYSETTCRSVTRDDLCTQAIRLGRILVDLTDDPEAMGLLGLMLLHESRRSARVDTAGELVLLENQDRALWDRGRVAEAQILIERALGARRVGPYLLQAAIAAVHAEAGSTHDTDWAQIVGLYDVLCLVDPSPVVALNRAAALGMRDGPEAGLNAIANILDGGSLDDYHLAHAARADMLRRLGRVREARAAYERALELTRQPAEQRFLKWRLDQLTALQPQGTSVSNDE